MIRCSMKVLRFFSSHRIVSRSRKSVHRYAYVVLQALNPLIFAFPNIRRCNSMKTLRLPDNAHQKLTSMIGEIMMQTKCKPTQTP